MAEMATIADDKPRPDVRHQPGLAAFEAIVFSPHAPVTIQVDREELRALLRYVRRLERDVQRVRGEE